MYNILVVDDEPVGLKHVSMIIKKKCPHFQVIATAENGKEALEIMHNISVDVVITDIQMPIMDGIKFVQEIQQEYPNILKVIVSGYSEFEYAKKALQAGVCDYLLKPLVPEDMKKLLDSLKIKLDYFYYQKRNEILKILCNGGSVELRDLNCYFPEKKFYAALFRENGLLGNLQQNRIEIFSMMDEKIYIYGRDEREGLYLIPEQFVFGGDFISYSKSIFNKELKKGDYVTGIVFNQTFDVTQLSEVAQYLYRRLAEHITIGKNQLILSNDEIEHHGISQDEQRIQEIIEEQIMLGSFKGIKEKILQLFQIWKTEEKSQLYMEATTRYFIHLIFRNRVTCFDIHEIEFLLQETFSYAANMDELSENLYGLIKQLLPDCEKETVDDKESLLNEILNYINLHITESLTLGKVCKQFGVSQTSLNRMFRTYKDTSFSVYLTTTRIEKAKNVMNKNPHLYIKEVAERVGYNDQFYFSRIFRTMEGICPSEYIEKCSLKMES